jgi:glycosyltransferase involved in cell wall biosynthesis
MFKAWRLKRRLGCQWTVFLWDPPSLSHRDRFPPLRWAIDALFRFFAKRCDKLVLNIHPGLLDEIGYKPRDGQVELRMQDAFENMDLGEVESGSRSEFEYDFGVLSNWSKAKGGDLVAAALRKLSGKKCLWIGDPPSGKVCEQIYFAGRLPQEEAFKRLKKCRVLLAPYLPVRSLKWNYVLKLFEYLQLERPIIASDNPGNVAVAERYPGRMRLFTSGDVEALENEMRLELKGIEI